MTEGLVKRGICALNRSQQLEIWRTEVMNEAPDRGFNALNRDLNSAKSGELKESMKFHVGLFKVQIRVLKKLCEDHT